MEQADLAACAKIVAQAIRAIPGKRIDYLDHEDLTQELLLAAVMGQRAVGTEDTARYVRVCVQNAVRSLYAHTLAARRYPRDQFGRPVTTARAELEDHESPQPSPEAQVAVREQITRLLSRLPAKQRALVKQCLVDERELGPRLAADIGYYRPSGGRRG